MGSILMNRGDRFSWTGDAHPTQATSMTAFSNFDFVFNNLNRTKGDCQGIATYCLYFVLSVSDYFTATGDVAGVAFLAPFVESHLDDAANMWDDPNGLRFVGWDDRTGSGTFFN
jgi:alpha-L-rhamnosidase